MDNFHDRDASDADEYQRQQKALRDAEIAATPVHPVIAYEKAHPFVAPFSEPRTEADDQAAAKALAELRQMLGMRPND